MGFWSYPARGRGMHARQLLEQLRTAQQSGNLPAAARAGFVDQKYPIDQFPGPSAWISGQWKLHREAGKKEAAATYRLFNLAEDLREEQDLSRKEPARLESMKDELANWQKSVVKSLNGSDYPQAKGK
jgi:hypothetical protein